MWLKQLERGAGNEIDDLGRPCEDLYGMEFYCYCEYDKKSLRKKRM